MYYLDTRRGDFRYEVRVMSDEVEYIILILGGVILGMRSE